MALYCNFPFFTVFLAMVAAILLSVVKNGRFAYRVTLLVAGLDAALSGVFLYFSAREGSAFAFTMGKFAAPFGNELRLGPLQGLMGACFCLVLFLALLGGRRDLFADVLEKKLPLYCVMLNMTLASLLVLTYTNDAFTAYVFIEIGTIAACALVMAKDRGPTLIATVRYLFMSLLGSGLFLLGLALLYSVTGHLLMPQLRRAIVTLAQSGEHRLTLLTVAGLMTAGLGVKSAMFPFHRWLPDAHGSATTASSAILSGLVLKGYIMLLILLFCRVFTLPVIRSLGVGDAVFVFGLLGMIAGSLHAMRESHIKRMLAYSSVAQIGYIFMGIGLGTELGVAAACFHVLVHAVTKPLLFLCAGRFSALRGHRKDLFDLTGVAYRDLLGGVGFTVGALSMIGIPLFAGFTSKLNFAAASFQSEEKMLLTLLVLALSSVLNALYYIPAVTAIWSHRRVSAAVEAEGESAAEKDGSFAVAAVALIALIFILGIFYGPIQRVITKGLQLL